MAPEVWTALIGAAAGGLLAAVKYTLDQRARMQDDLWSRRLDPYRAVWAASGLFSRWPRREVTHAQAVVLHGELRGWYYGDGGILMSARARKRYEYVQRGLEVIVLGPELDDEDYYDMVAFFSGFRSALTDDLESRRKRSIFWSLLDLGHELRVRRTLAGRYRTMLARHRLTLVDGRPRAELSRP